MAEVFQLIETHAHDPKHGGYTETLARDWQPVAGVLLSDKDLNAPKSMNNHLHVLEAYTNLYHVWPEELLRTRLEALIDLFLDHILDGDGTHFHHFFDEAWTPRTSNYTYGHDIEGSWLLCEAADALGSAALQGRVRAVAVAIARAVLEEGLDADGGLCYEGTGGHVTDTNREWWPQAEAVVGFLNAYQLTGDDTFREAAARCWSYIENHFIDRTHGEWFWRIARGGTPDPAEPKVSAWKGPYHNGRACLEVLHRTN